jgi:hypothetical protein
MLRAAARRLLALFLLGAVASLAVGLVYGLFSGTSAARAIAIGFYLVGSFLLISGFFVGNRGPARLKREDDQATLFSPRTLRWATREEREESINLSAVFVALGFVLILVGVAADARYSLW